MNWVFFSGLLPSFTQFYWVLPSYFGIYLVLKAFD